MQLGAFNLPNRLVFNVNQGEPLVRANFTAINKLYKEQAYIQKRNSHPPPDTKKQSRFRKALLNSQKQSMIDYHLDPGVNTVMDGYCTQKKLSELCSIGMKDGTIVSMRNRVLVVHQAMFLTSHAMLLRGDNVRRIEFADFWVISTNDRLLI